jgi:hypothetical protein
MRFICMAFVTIFYSKLLFAQDRETKIDERLIKCVVHITIPASNPNLSSAGTGFLVSINDLKTNNGKVFLVTNKHMIGHWNLVDPFIPFDSITVDFYSKSQSYPIVQKTIRLKSRTGRLNNKTFLHPNSLIDIALIELTDMFRENSNSDISWHIADTIFLTRSNKMQENKISYGEQVFAIGYPADVRIASSNLPIAKSSYIASSTAGNFKVNIPIVSRKGDTLLTSPEGNFYLVDGLIIGGNSGGPVLCTNQLTTNLAEDKKSFIRKWRPSTIIGVVSMGLGNTGISVIYSSENILDLINEVAAKDLR